MSYLEHDHADGEILCGNSETTAQNEVFFPRNIYYNFGKQKQT